MPSEAQDRRYKERRAERELELYGEETKDEMRDRIEAEHQKEIEEMEEECFSDHYTLWEAAQKLVAGAFAGVFVISLLAGAVIAWGWETVEAFQRENYVKVVVLVLIAVGLLVWMGLIAWAASRRRAELRDKELSEED